MTKRHSHKRLVRRRMAETGSTYSTARAALRRQAKAVVARAPVAMIAVSDLDASVAFYAEALGLRPTYVSPDGTFAALGEEPTTVTLHADGTPTAVDTGLGLLVADLAGVCDAVSRCGGAVGEADPRDTITVRDPDNNRIRLVRG